MSARTVTIYGGDRRPGERMPALSEVLKPQPLPELKVERGVPIPRSRRIGQKSPARTVLDNMEPGDSVLIPRAHHSPEAVHVMVRAVRKANPGRSYTSRQAEGGMRVWRVE
jgi:hypothetical protein